MTQYEIVQELLQQSEKATKTVTNHKMRESGYAEINEEARVVTKGCIKNVLNGKAFAKAYSSLKAVNEALEHLLLEVFCKEENVEIHPTRLLTLIELCKRSNLEIFEIFEISLAIKNKSSHWR